MAPSTHSPAALRDDAPPMTRREVAAFLRCGLQSVDRRIREGSLRAVRIGPRRVVVTHAAVRAFLASGWSPRRKGGVRR